MTDPSFYATGDPFWLALGLALIAAAGFLAAKLTGPLHAYRCDQCGHVSYDLEDLTGHLLNAMRDDRDKWRRAALAFEAGGHSATIHGERIDPETGEIIDEDGQR